MSTKFFTNKDQNTLQQKFKGIFEHLPVHYFDALGGLSFAHRVILKLESI